MFCIESVDHNGEVAIAVTQIVRLLAIEIHRQFDFEWRGRMTQIDQPKVREFEMVGHSEPESARIEVKRSGFIEYANHRVNRLCHSVQLLEIAYDRQADFGFG